MARRLPYLLSVVQRSFATCGRAASETTPWLRRTSFKSCKTGIIVPFQVTSSCRRFQHFHSTDAYADDEEDEPRTSRRGGRPKEHELVLVPIIQRGEPLSSLQWQEVENNVLALETFVNKENIHGIIMNLCVKLKKFEVGTSLLDALEERDCEANIATLSSYLKLCFDCNAGEEKKLLAIVDDIRRKCPILDSSTADRVIHGLSLTSRWMESFDLLADIRLTSVPSASTFMVLTKTAFENGELKKGWSLMEEMVRDNLNPSPAVYNAWIDQAWSAGESDGKVMIGQLLEFWADNELRPSLEVASHLRRWFERDRYSWEGCFTSLSPWGSCMDCRTRLKKLHVSPQQFETMKQHFFDQVIVGSNVFLKTNPEELETFQQYLKRTAPYDVVVDGLNVAYSTGMLQPPVAARILRSVVQQLVDENQKVLVLGRRHMQNWPKPEMRYIHQNASVFLAQNISQDDPFLLYAAMFSGPHTTFVSRDLMRSHKFLLQDRALRKIFRLWQQKNQLLLRNMGRGNVVVKPALAFNPNVQQGPGSVWHIPYDKDYSLKPKQLYDAPLHWLCLRKADKVDGWDDFYQDN